MEKLHTAAHLQMILIDLETVDGESNSYFQSSTSANQWWRVDLGRSYYVGVIKVYSSQCKTWLCGYIFK